MKLVFILVALSIVVLSATKDDSNNNFDEVRHVRDAVRKKKNNKLGNKPKMAYSRDAFIRD